MPCSSLPPRSTAGSAPGPAATIALLLGYLGVLAGTEAVYYTRAVGPSGDDYTGLLSVLAGLLLLGLGTVTLWRSRRLDDRLWWRYGRRLLFGVATAVIAVAVLVPFAIGYAVTHALRAEVPRAELGTGYEDVEFTTSDGLKLKGWYIPSNNGAAVISFPGRSGMGGNGPEHELCEHEPCAGGQPGPRIWSQNWGAPFDDD